VTDDRPVPVSAGTQLGRFTVLKPLVSTSGGITEVLLARAQGMGGFAHHVVIKTIRAGKTVDQSVIDAFVDEARLSASLHHSHIVQVHDVGRENDDYYFAMEYVHGENLRALLAKVARDGALVPLDQIITIVLAVAAGLHYAHQQSIVHRDVTPTNILIGYDGNVKVTDFGIAKALLKSSDATKSGTLRGKVAYMAPEQCLGRPIDRRADIFSLGIVLYELVTSRRLFKGDTDFLVMTSIVNGKIPKPTSVRKDLPVDLEDVIMKALAPKPELRFATAEELAIALENVAIANHIRVSTTALAEYGGKLFGTRAEPWLVDTKLEPVDVDFDGSGSGLVEIDAEPSNPAIEKELLQSPLMSLYGHEDDDELSSEFGDEGATQIQEPEHDDEPPTLVPAATSGFEANERTLLGDQDDVDMLVHMSTLGPRHDPTPLPPPMRADTTPIPRVQMPLPQQPQPQPQPQPLARVDRSQPLPPMVVTPPQLWGSSPSGTGTPMAWSADGEVPSLRPNSRRALLIAAVGAPIIAIGIFLLVRGGGDEPRRAKTVAPDAFVEPPVIDAAAAQLVPDAPPPDAAVAAMAPIAPPTPPVVVRKPAIPPKRPPSTKKPPLKR
jgi:eukaryotic-like serine/threonine-protein kinase